jgi:hypothetical protein
VGVDLLLAVGGGVPSRLWVMLTVRVLGSLVPPSPSATRRARLRLVVGLESALR